MLREGPENKTDLYMSRVSVCRIDLSRRFPEVGWFSNFVIQSNQNRTIHIPSHLCV